MTLPTVLVLGLGKGVGAACVRRFLEDDRVVMAADPNADAIDRLMDAPEDRLVTRQIDLHTKLGLKNAIAAATEGLGPADTMVVIPPIPDTPSLLTADFDDIDRAHARTQRAAQLAIRLFCEQLEGVEVSAEQARDRSRSRGSIVFVLGMAARFAEPGRYAEALTQGGIEALVRAASVELAAQNIRCNAVAAVRPRAENEEPWLKARTPLGRAALADEIADAVAFLAAPQTGFITGETLVVDGGRSRLGGLLGAAD